MTHLEKLKKDTLSKITSMVNFVKNIKMIFFSLRHLGPGLAYLKKSFEKPMAKMAFLNKMKNLLSKPNKQ